MKDLAIYCAGGFGREIYCMIFKTINNGKWRFIGFFDDGIEKGQVLQYGKCLGGLADVNAWTTPLDIVIANGNPTMLKRISEGITNPLVDFPNIVHPTCTMADADTVQLGRGNIFCIDCHLSCNVEIGNFNVMNGHISFGHEVKVGNCNAFMPSSRISGGVTIGDSNLFGAMSFVVQYNKIGTGVNLGPGSILLTKPKNNSTYIGNPAKMFKF